MEPPGGAAIETITPLEAPFIRVAVSENPVKISHPRPTLLAKVRGGGGSGQTPPFGTTRGYQKALGIPGLIHIYIAVTEHLVLAIALLCGFCVLIAFARIDLFGCNLN